MKRAVGRGLFVEELVFLRIGCGITAGALGAAEEDVVLGLDWLGWWRAVTLVVLGP
jgi:hypothetical protein